MLFNVNVNTYPTGRSPKGKFYFGENTSKLCKDRPKDCQIGNMLDYEQFAEKMKSCDYEHKSMFRTCGIDFNVATTSVIHDKFVGNMFSYTKLNSMPSLTNDWTIYLSLIHI